MPRSAPGPRTGCPSHSTWPAVGSSSPATRFSSVLLPHPEGPIRATNSPGATLSDTLSNARNGLPCTRNSLLTPRSSTAGVGRTPLASLGIRHRPFQEAEQAIQPEAHRTDHADADDDAGDVQVVPLVPHEVADTAAADQHL